jgi:hypothetical protein
MNLTRIVFALLPITFAAAGDRPLEIPLGLDSFLPVPEANPLTPSKVGMENPSPRACREGADSGVFRPL